MSRFTAKSRQLFNYAHSLSAPDFYSPAEDTYLFLDTLESHIDSIVSLSVAPLVLEIGPGSGVISAFCTRALTERGCVPRMIGLDVNLAALKATTETFKCVDRTMFFDGLLCDGTTCALRGRVFDLIMCNPPYVPSDRNEFDHPLTAAWAGGLPDGREVTDQVIIRSSELLTSNGILLLLLDQRNDPSAVVSFAERFGLKGLLLAKKKVPGELLYVYQFTRI